MLITIRFPNHCHGYGFLCLYLLSFKAPPLMVACFRHSNSNVSEEGKKRVEMEG